MYVSGKTDVKGLWEALKRHARAAYEEDRLYIEGHAIIPLTYHLGFRCGGCGRAWWVDFSRMAADPEELAGTASRIWVEAMEAGCPSCCSKVMEFFGYVCTCTSSVYNTHGSTWRGGRPPTAEELQKLPRFRAYTVVAVTAFGMALTGVARIEERAGVIVTGELELKDGKPEELEGTTLIPLSKVRLGAETPMYR